MAKLLTSAAMLWLMLLPAVSVDAAGRPAFEIEEQVRERLATESGEYVITVGNTFTTLPTEYDSLHVEPLGESALLGSCWIKVFFFKENALWQTVSLNIQVSLYQQVLVARESVKRDQPLTSDLFDSARREITSLTDRPVLSASELQDMVAARQIPQGKILTRSQLAKEQVVKRGSMVTIEYVRGNLKVTTAGEAKQGGARGEIIKVRNISSNKIVAAEVQDEKSVRVLR